ncbi:MAG: GNAT family N-acetyltransferase [Candidatus Eremiobacteraeota bacterium]|nr:GNAT family N-acetyltransferase [Candidatus Eremiobacteraeota bacterium]
MAVTISRVRGEDAFAALQELLVEYERSLPADLRHGSEPDLQFVRRSYAEPNAAFLARVALEGAGCVALVRLDPLTACVQRLYVRARCRGLGAGRLLVQTVIETARERGYDRLVLDTHAQRLPAAYQLYHSLGFADCEPFGSVGYACPTYMELRL